MSRDVRDQAEEQAEEQAPAIAAVELADQLPQSRSDRRKELLTMHETAKAPPD